MKEWTIAELQEAYRKGETTPRQICEDYLDRIKQVDASGPRINAIIETNPDVLAIADRCTAEIASGTSEGLLHGIPVLLKDNIDTEDQMMTTAGSIALEGVPCSEDAFIVKRLRAEGAIILGKTNLSEWANFRSSRSSSGWSSRGGQTRNPHVLDRTPCGSSSGSGAAVAANLAVLAVGTETDGSVTCPAAHASIVGFKPSLGVIGRSGIVPIAASQDTAGPMARTVTDAVLLLRALAGADPADEAAIDDIDLNTVLDANSLKGKRIGVAPDAGAFHPGVAKVFAEALAALKDAGAEIVEAKLPEEEKAGEDELTVLHYEFKAGLAAYFARRGGPLANIEDVVAFNKEHADRVMPIFGQEHMEEAAKCGPLTDLTYTKAQLSNRQRMGPDGISALLASKKLDALVAPTNGPAWLIDHVNGDSYGGGGGLGSPAAVAGYPHVTVPMGDYRGLPLGLSIVGDVRRDAQVLSLAFAFEAATRARRVPEFHTTVAPLP